MNQKIKKVISIIVCMFFIFSITLRPSYADKKVVEAGGKNYSIIVLQDGGRILRLNTKATVSNTAQNLTAQEGNAVLGVSVGGKVIDTGSTKKGVLTYKIVKEGTQYKWYLKGYNKSKVVVETASNAGDLNSFRTKVNEITLKEAEIAGFGGTAALATITTFIAGAPATFGFTAIVAALTAIGCALTGAVIGAQLLFLYKDVKFYFNRI